MCSSLKSNYEKLKSRGFLTPSDSITSLSRELKIRADDDLTDELIVKLINCFKKSMNIDFTLGDLSIAESAIMESYILKFNDEKWNYGK
jgi:lipoate-protein ligase A